MFSRILHSTRRLFSTAQQKARNAKMLKTMSQKLQSMKQTMDKTTPRSMAILFILSTIPSFYLIQQSQEYQQFTSNSLKYFYVKNFIFYSTSLILYKMCFKNPSSKYTLERVPIKFQYIPLILTFIGFMLPPSDSKHIVWPAFVTDVFTMAVEVQLTNQGVVPFWFYSYRHYIRFFDFLIFITLYQTLKKYKDRKEKYSHQFVKEIDTIKGENYISNINGGQIKSMKELML